MSKEKILIGTWAWGSGANGSTMIFGKKLDKETLSATFETAYKLGFKNWDTAAVYGMGTCESFLGELTTNKKDIFISTKFMPPKKYKQGDLAKSFEESMTRLKRETADLFWIHVPNNLEANIKEAIPLIQSDKIKAIGISNVSLDHIKLAEKLLGEHKLKLGAVQNHFSLLRTDQQPIIDYCNQNSITYYAYMVLEQGALSGHYSAEHHFPTFSMRNFAFPKSKFKKIDSLLKTMKAVAEEHNIDSSQVPILWALSKGAIPIVGLTKPRHAETLVEAMKVKLSSDEISRIEKEAQNTKLRQQGVWEPQ